MVLKSAVPSAAWTNTTITTVTRTVSPSQFLDCSGNKCLSTLDGSLEGLLHILKINKTSQAELIEAGKEIQSNKMSILIQMFYILADVEVDINSAYSVHATQKVI